MATCVDAEGALDVLGGAGVGHCVFENMGTWMSEDPRGGRERVLPWQSEQGYECERRNLLGGVADVLRLARIARDLTA